MADQLRARGTREEDLDTERAKAHCYHPTTETLLLPSGGRIMRCPMCNKQWPLHDDTISSLPPVIVAPRDPIVLQPGSMSQFYALQSPDLFSDPQPVLEAGTSPKAWERRKAVEDAARAAATAFDQGVRDESMPVKLDPARKLKIVS